MGGALPGAFAAAPVTNHNTYTFGGLIVRPFFLCFSFLRDSMGDFELV